MLSGILFLWFLLTLLSLAFVIYDQLTNTPSMNVMKLAWFLVILYTGPVGLYFYFLSCRQPMPNTHDDFINVHWKQALGSEIHCVAGDATAIIIAAIILYFFQLPNGLEAIIEYCAAYLFGLFIFQALFMRAMFKTYREAVIKTIFVETVSMNMVMAGMLPTILILKYLFPSGNNPATLLFWGIMSAATIVGFIFAYPINSWMVRIGLKHGMMSKPQKKTKSHHHMMVAKPLSASKQTFWIVATFAFLFLVTWIAGQFIPIRFG